MVWERIARGAQGIGEFRHKALAKATRTLAEQTCEAIQEFRDEWDCISQIMVLHMRYGLEAPQICAWLKEHRPPHYWRTLRQVRTTCARMIGKVPKNTIGPRAQTSAKRGALSFAAGCYLHFGMSLEQIATALNRDPAANRRWTKARVSTALDRHKREIEEELRRLNGDAS
jgi:hypothetical protein